MESQGRGKIVKFHWELDEDGKTLLRPLSNEDQTEIHQALENQQGITIGPNLLDSKECPVDPGVPFPISNCAIEAEKGSANGRMRQLARERWDEGDRKLAEKLIDGLKGAEGGT